MLVKGKAPGSFPPSFVAKRFTILKQQFDTILYSEVLNITVVTSGLNVAIYIPETLRPLSGMCGDADGNRNNDINVSLILLQLHYVLFHAQFLSSQCRSNILNIKKLCHTFQRDNAETRIEEFVERYKTDPLCEESEETFNAEEMCDRCPDRRAWAEDVCNTLRTGAFRDCYDSLPDDIANVAYQSCLHDACGCKEGDDCVCTCANLASFSQFCSSTRGLSIRWRTQDRCCELFVVL